MTNPPSHFPPAPPIIPSAPLPEEASHACALETALRESARLAHELRAGRSEAASALCEALEKKDRATAGHARRVAHFAVRIGREWSGALELSCGRTDVAARLDEEQLETLRIAALLHDVGKIGIEDRILGKASALDEFEKGIMRTHPELGFQILRRVGGLLAGDVVDGMRFHHERWDGGGYPAGLRGAEIPWIARIVAVADAYDAIVATRPYRKGADADVAVAEILGGSGTQFDPSVVAAFARAFDLVAR